MCLHFPWILEERTRSLGIRVVNDYDPPHGFWELNWGTLRAVIKWTFHLPSKLSNKTICYNDLFCSLNFYWFFVIRRILIKKEVGWKLRPSNTAILFFTCCVIFLVGTPMDKLVSLTLSFGAFYFFFSS